MTDPRTAEPASADGAFSVQIASSGEVVAVPADQSVYQVLSAHGIEIPVSCEQGLCGTCLTRVLAGVPDHQDMYLSPDEQDANDQFTPCCSRAKTALLVLDL
jgi:vanillate O-demethylase ferredoxin subunit